MRATGQGELPKDLMEARSRFEAWRQRRQGRDRIPPSLWALAVRLVRTHGLSRTATALRLDYYSLKKQVETAAGPVPPSVSAFVELPAPLGLGKQCLFERVDGTGGSRRLQLVGYDAAAVEALARHFWNAE
ncbi:MAG TPA: hypothetical protein VKD72_37415 [Gemmataceae bacterium]|nr:hypothetical protein [Gemmataceae bacterium]